MNNQIDDFFGLQPDQSDASFRERIRDTLGKKKVSWANRLRLMPAVLSFRERYGILVFLVLIIGATLSLPFTTYYHFTVAQPAPGGSLTEGIVGEPRLINPLLSQVNDADRDLTALIYSGLLKYGEDGSLVPDLAKSYDISSDGLTYTVYLKKNAQWHDGIPVTADDIIFTVQTAQNPDYGSIRRINWQGVEVDKIDDHTLMFKLKNRYAQFLNNLTMGILPKHLWQDVKPISFTLHDLNLKPIGSGPYQFKKFKRSTLGSIESYTLAANEQFYDGRPYIDTLELKFYPSEDTMIDAYNHNDVENLGYISAENINKIKFKQRLVVEQMKLPRYFATFFNQTQSAILSDRNVRLALARSTNRQVFIDHILNGNGVAVHSPLIDGILDIATHIPDDSFNLAAARDILKTAGWGNPDKDGILNKDKTRLALKITTSTWPELVEVATMIQAQWRAAGIDATVETLPVAQLQQVIHDRSYEVLLFGEILTIDPDPFTLWHSSQKRDPGINLALYDNKAADKLLEDARTTISPVERAKKYDDFQQLVTKDIPALFLYSPYYLYPHSRTIQGFTTKIISMPSDRFANITHWYINTKRVWRS